MKNENEKSTDTFFLTFLFYKNLFFKNAETERKI